MVSSIYESAQKAYNNLVEITRGGILTTQPFSLWLEKQKQAGKYWGA